MTTQEYISCLIRQYQRVPCLEAGEEADLVRRWQELGDEEARRRLVTANMRHVVAIARRFSGRSVRMEDLLAEGCLGLLVGIDRFDAARGVRLATYARYWIRAYVLRAMNREWKKGKTGLGKIRWTAFFRARRTREAHLARFGEDGLSLEEMARELGMDVQALCDLLGSPEIHDLSLDLGGDHASGTDLHERLASDVPGPEADASRRETLAWMSEIVERAMEGLSERERIVARSRLMEEEPETLRELGDRLGVSRERVRQIETQVRRKLDSALRHWPDALECAV